ncbi:MAG: copper transporter, partial [Demequinaceae bacterium]|nr:copper transporter [Demequinaceae bacterium]
MIDFRYHVVSLTAVFLALAVGVVLGSGPLRTALVSELTNESSELKAALAESKAETASAIEDATIGEEFIDQAAEVLIGDVLDGSHVAVVR